MGVGESVQLKCNFLEAFVAYLTKEILLTGGKIFFRHCKKKKSIKHQNVLLVCSEVIAICGFKYR